MRVSRTILGRYVELREIDVPTRIRNNVRVVFYNQRKKGLIQLMNRFSGVKKK